MDKDTLLELKNWFNAYVAGFRCDNVEDQKNIDLKIAHTHRVCREILALGQSQALNQTRLNLAEGLALFHDIGRFEQYQRYKTYCDDYSEDHAQLGIRILREKGILEKLEPEIRQLIVCVIANHNRAAIAQETTAECRFFTELLRDADKLDIWKVVTDYYRDIQQQPNAVIELDLPNTPGISEKVYSDLLSSRIVMKGHVKNLNDFKLLQIGWLFDVNFPKTFQLIKARHYLNEIFKALPPLAQISKIANHVFAYLDTKCPSSISI